MTLRPRVLAAACTLALGPALGLPGPRASAHPLLRIHVRPSAYRLAPPRLPSVVRQVVASAAPVFVRAVITRAPARALMGRR